MRDVSVKEATALTFLVTCGTLAIGLVRLVRLNVGKVVLQWYLKIYILAISLCLASTLAPPTHSAAERGEVSQGPLKHLEEGGARHCTQQMVQRTWSCHPV